MPNDAARRASDTVALALLADRGNVGRWLAIRLSDGGSDGILYDSVSDAADAQLHHSLCAYVRITDAGLPPREAEVLLDYHRRLYQNGHRPPYLEGWTPIIPNTVEEMKHGPIRYGRPT